MVYEAGCAVHRQRQRLGLHVVVAQHQLRDFLGHLTKQVIAILDTDLSRINRSVEKNLDVDFVIRSIDTSGIVNGIGMAQATQATVFDSGELG